MFSDNSLREYNWSGANNTLARYVAGYQLAQEVRRIRSVNPAEPINIVAHSHGGNVALIATKFGAKIDNLVTLGTPARMLGHKPNVSNIDNWYNAYSPQDMVQVSGGGSATFGYQEVGPAGRTFSGAVNISVQSTRGPIGAHSDLTGAIGANAVRSAMRPLK